MAKLFIVGFPYYFEEAELLKLFSAFGIVDSVNIVVDKITGRSKCYGFVDMRDQLGADQAIRLLDNTQLDNRKISVRLADVRSKFNN